MRDVTRWAASLLVAAVIGFAAPASATTQPVAPDEPEVIPPRILLKSQTAPVYPPAALAGRFTGEVEVTATVSPEGEVVKVTIVECTHPNLGFEDATAAAVRQWKFNPATQVGEPVPYELNFRMAFDWRGEKQAFVTSGDLAGTRSVTSKRDGTAAQSRLDPPADGSRSRGPGRL